MCNSNDVLGKKQTLTSAILKQRIHVSCWDHFEIIIKKSNFFLSDNIGRMH